MKISPAKFGLALGLAFGISFLICNIILVIGGNKLSLSVVNTLFHDMDFNQLMVDNGFDFGKLVFGMLILFLTGLFIGYVTAAMYNAFSKMETK